MYHLTVEIIKLNNIACGLSISAGNLLTFFLAVCNNWLVRVIGHAGKWPEIMVTRAVFKKQLTALHVVCIIVFFKRYVFILLTKMWTETKTVPLT